MAIPIMIGDRWFKTKRAATDFMKPILNDPPLDSVVLEPGHTFLADLVALHPDATAKIGAGVSHFSIERNAYSGRGFRLHRVDETSTDFSVYRCFDGKHNRKAQVQLALRTASMHQVSAFREQQFIAGPVFCPITGTTLTRDLCHVDHQSPVTFDVLSQRWMHDNNFTIDTVAIESSADDRQGRKMTDLAQITSWQTFHRTHARLRLLSQRANLSDAKIQHNRDS